MHTATEIMAIGGKNKHRFNKCVQSLVTVKIFILIQKKKCSSHSLTMKLFFATNRDNSRKVQLFKMPSC